MNRKAFTLLELLLVMAIMGFMGTVAVGGYRAMRRGMEERSVMQNVNQFIRSAYQRAQIDRQPVAVYFWNETLREEAGDEPIQVVGKAVAVRRSGRLTYVDSDKLYDEFGDLMPVRDSDGKVVTSSAKDSAGIYLYKLNGDEQSGRMERSTVAEQPVPVSLDDTLILGGLFKIRGWGWTYKPGGQNGVNWKVGTAYGFEFANLQLPVNYLFGASYSKSVRQPVEGESDLHFSVSGNSGSGATQGIAGKSTIDVYSLRPGASGALTAQRVATSENPTQQLNN